MWSVVFLYEVSSLWGVCAVIGVGLCEVCAVRRVFVVSGVHLCEVCALCSMSGELCVFV